MFAAVRATILAMAASIVVVAATQGGSAAQEGTPFKRLALVIGEAAYPQARLPTASADAGLMAVALAQSGFDVTAVADADLARLRQTIADFTAKVRADGPKVEVAVYVAGDGLQFAGENWLVPVGARIEREEDVPAASLRLGDITGPLEAAPASTRLFLFDLARETPFARAGAPLAGGLMLAGAPGGSVYGFNTAPGAVAPADVPPFGVYARALAETMQVPGLTLGAVLRRVRLRVGERTNGAAVPFDDGATTSDFTFFPGPPAAGPPLPGPASPPPGSAYSAAIAGDLLPGYAAFAAAFPTDPLAERIRAMIAVRREALFWSEAVRVDVPRAYWTYMRRYPRGPHYGDARRRLFALHAALEPPPRFDIVTFEGLPPPSAPERALLDRPFVSFADGTGAPIPTPSGSLLPTVRRAFYDALPPPPLAADGALPLPLPVPTAGGHDPIAGHIEEPGLPGGTLVSVLGGTQEGRDLATSIAGGAPVSRVQASVDRGAQTMTQTAAGGALISKVTMVTGANGTLTTTQVGPQEAPLGRTTSRDVGAGWRETTLFDAAGRPLAVTVVSPADIVTTSATVPGRTVPPPFVLSRLPAAGASPAIAPARAQPLGRAALPPTPDRSDKASEGRGQDAGTEGTVVKPPAMPVAAGLTGQAPNLDIPPAAPTPAFDASAAPVTAPPPASSATSSIAIKPPGSVVPLRPAAAPNSPDAPPPASTPPATMQPPASAETSGAAHLPVEPPLPPRRGAPPVVGRKKSRGGR